MIKAVTDNSEVIKLWSEAFGDSKEEILFFIDNVNDSECIGYYFNNELASMLFLIKCRLNGVDSRYIYAACTLNKYRSKGFMTKLIDYCKEKYDCLCLIPASDGLISYYSERGINNIAEIRDIKFNQSNEIKEYLFEGYKLTEPKALYYQGGK
ncbi:MAG: GNAT family N-acetyltransferase [Eubacterium sp.]|nr:GNAT family N-acetyltransferase [Eubacterium sp.]